MMSGHCRHSCGRNREPGKDSRALAVAVRSQHSTSELQLWGSKRCSGADHQNQQHVAVPVLFNMGSAKPHFAVTAAARDLMLAESTAKNDLAG